MKKLAIGFGAFFLVSCSTPPATVQERADTLRMMVGQRAGFEMQCPPTKLKITKKDMFTFAARGCGQKMTYLVNPECQVGLTQEQIMRQCYFTMSSEVFSTSEETSL